MIEDLYESLLLQCEKEDDLGVVIRTHIIVEKYLNHLIDSLVSNQKYIREMHLDYLSTVRLAIALGLDDRFEKVLKCLGSLRNGFAHNLRPEISKEDVNNLYKALSAEEKKILNQSVDSTREKLQEDLPNHKGMNVRQQYINIVVLVAAALQTACNQVLKMSPNK
jgi:hypothetical protein